jgi:hypothetical protein
LLLKIFARVGQSNKIEQLFLSVDQAVLLFRKESGSISMKSKFLHPTKIQSENE